MIGATRHFLTVVALSAIPCALDAQFRPARTLDYLFVTGASDARALWVNPAGLAVLPEASVMGEFVLERPDDETRLAQWTIGLNSRGFSLGYRRDRFENENNMGTLRFGLGLPFTQGTLGVGFSWYSAEGDDARDVDVGALYGLAPSLNVAATMRHIGRPTVNGVPLPITFAGGVHWAGLQGVLQLQAEGQAMEDRRAGESGWDLAYRGGAIITIPQISLTLLGNVDVSSDFNIDHVHFGFAVGGRTSATAVATAMSRMGDPVLNAVSATGVASNVLLGQR
jgi:hypothetical protein